jgi:hypothetical protein
LLSAEELSVSGSGGVVFHVFDSGGCQETGSFGVRVFAIAIHNLQLLCRTTWGIVSMILSKIVKSCPTGQNAIPQGETLGIEASSAKH